MFRDPKVIEKAKKLVMVRVDSDQNAVLGKKYALDGSYVPRTFFVMPSGELAADVNAGRNDFKYFFDEADPASLIAGMDAALQRAK